MTRNPEVTEILLYVVILQTSVQNKTLRLADFSSLDDVIRC